LTTAMGSFRRS